VSYNLNKGTLRGMHYQAAPHEEDKVIRCTAGSIFDVIVDIRTGSPSYGRWFGTRTHGRQSARTPRSKGLRPWLLTLADESEVLYMISPRYAPDCARGFRWDDPNIAIAWPMKPLVISARDAAYRMLDHGSR